MKTSPRTLLACLSSIERLESRIALTRASFSFVDGDGDQVTIEIKSPSIISEQDIQDAATRVETAPGSGMFQLQTLDLTDSKFSQADVKITVKKVPGRDCRVNVGYINATGFDLGVVTVAGDLGQIDCGDGDPASGAALDELNVKSLGRFGLTTQGAGGSLTSNIQGALTKLNVKGNISEATVNVVGLIDTVNIGGSILGGDAANSGSIFSTDMIKTTSIGGSLLGGNGPSSGNLVAGGKLGFVEVKGTVLGGDGDFSGLIKGTSVDRGITITGKLIGGTGEKSGRLETGGNTAKVKTGGLEAPKGAGAGAGTIASVLGLKSLEVAGDVRGGAGADSGSIEIAGFVPMVKIHGSVIGGTADGSGVLKFGSVRSLLITGDIFGGSISDAVSLSRSGHIFAGRIDALSIGGSVFAGTDESTGTLAHSGSIITTDGIGTLAIGGSLMGNATQRLLISTAGGQDDVGFGKISVGGDVLHADLLAGFTSGGVFVNADLKIGAVAVGRSLIASNVVAGAGAGGDGKFGTPDDTSVGAAINDAAKISSIASIVIKGQAEGDPALLVPGANFGIVANHIGALSTDGCKTPFTKGVPDVFRIGSSGGGAGDFFAHEVPA